jgi:transcriptional regulator GlxA family with amidase domain
MLEELQVRLGAGLATEPHGVPRCERVVARLREEPSAPIAGLASSEGISHGHLDRLFGRVVGLSPVRLGRVLRVRRLLEQLDVFDPPQWARLAASEGWFDQAHLIRAFRRHTGVTPADYVGAQRRHFAPKEAAPGFVPSA